MYTFIHDLSKISNYYHQIFTLFYCTQPVFLNSLKHSLKVFMKLICLFVACLPIVRTLTRVNAFGSTSN